MDASGQRVVGNNGAVGSVSGTPATITTPYIGSRGSNFWINNCVRSLALYNQRLPDAILKQKSSVGAPY